MIKLLALEYTFYSLLPYLIINTVSYDVDIVSMVCDILWKIPNYILSIIIFAHYISQLHVYKPDNNINIINSRYKIVRLIASKIETSIISMIYPLIGGLIPCLSHIINCIIIAEILYSGYDIRRRLYLYYSVRYNLLRILLYGIPLTILQCLCHDVFILNYLYNILIIIQIEWMMSYPTIYRLHIPTYHHKII